MCVRAVLCSSLPNRLKLVSHTTSVTHGALTVELIQGSGTKLHRSTFDKIILLSTASTFQSHLKAGIRGGDHLLLTDGSLLVYHIKARILHGN